MDLTIAIGLMNTYNRLAISFEIHRRSVFREADRHAVVSVHQADRDRQIHELALLEHCARGPVGFIWHAGLGNARYRFGPCKRGALALVEKIASFRPRLHQRQLFDFLPFLEQVARVHVEAIGAVVDLRDSQIDEVDQHSGKAALHDVAVDAAQRFHACRCDLVVVETLAHLFAP